MTETVTNDSPQASTTSLILRILKQLWMVLIIVGLLMFVANNFSDILTYLKNIPLENILLSLLFIAIGRTLMMLVAYDSLLALGENITRKTVFIIVSISDPAKYLPGGVWHFVGRAGYYQAEGISLKSGSQALLRENLWLIVSAGFSGGIFLIVAYSTQNIWLICGVFLAIWWIILKLWNPLLTSQAILRLLITQFLMWISLALSFLLILPNLTNALDSNALIISAFIISWLIGFVSLFAPSGLGIREAVLVALLLPVLSPSDSAIFALTHRILWIAVELIFTLVAWVVLNIDNREH